VAIDEAVRLAHWFGGSRAPGFVNGVLDGIAHAPGTAVRSRSRRMNILAVNWQDLETPRRRSRVHLFEILAPARGRGHRVRLICSGWPGAPRARPCGASR
jgi:hypothetical protein